MSKKVVITGAGGFIGGHLVARMLNLGCEVVGGDIKPLESWWQIHEGAQNHVADLSLKEECLTYLEGADEVYNLASDMGGMGFIEANKALCMLNVLINTHLLMAARDHGVSKYFYSSSACIYPQYLQDKTEVVALKEDSAYPAMPEDGYGWEKLYSERMCRHFYEDFGVDVRVARFHNVYGPNGSWCDGREKAPAAICRKVAEAVKSGNHTIEVWGDGQQTRSFMYIDDCLDGVLKLMDSEHREPINIGRDDMVTINELITIVENIAGVQLERNYKTDAPQGVRGRNSDNTKILEVLGWKPDTTLQVGLKTTFDWISQNLNSV